MHRRRFRGAIAPHTARAHAENTFEPLLSPRALRHRAALRRPWPECIAIDGSTLEAAIEFAPDASQAVVLFPDNRSLDLFEAPNGEWYTGAGGEPVVLHAAPPAEAPAAQVRSELAGATSMRLVDALSTQMIHNATEAAAPDMSHIFGGLLGGQSEAAHQSDALDIVYTVWRVVDDIAVQVASGEANVYVLELPPVLREAVSKMSAGEGRRFWVPRGSALRDVRGRPTRPWPVRLPTEPLVIDFRISSIDRDAVFFSPMDEHAASHEDTPSPKAEDVPALVRMGPQWWQDMWSGQMGPWLAAAMNAFLYIAISKLGVLWREPNSGW